MSEPPKPVRIFIDENVVVHEGREAEELLRTKEEARRIDPQRGVTQVERTRWEEAQRYERRTWLEKRQFASSDRNEHHGERFASYSCLRGMTFQRGIELGCGPFTNMRLILRHCRIEEIHLLDPLIEDYLMHPFCRYRYRKLGGILLGSPWLGALAFRHPGRFLDTVSSLYHLGGLFGHPVKLIPSMIESFDTNLRFDLIVMINVIEHCQDAAVLFRKVSEILTPGGVFVFHDRMYRADEVRERTAILYDAGHPLRVDQSVVKAFLERHFDPLMNAEYRIETEFRGLRSQETELYYIGRKSAT